MYLSALAFALGVVLGTLAYAIGSKQGTKELRRAFEALEEEFEDLRDNVRSGLGRISRLKRTVMQGEVSQQDAEPSSPE